jgi:hypothetical protein
VAQEQTYLTITAWPLVCAGGVLAIACVSLALISVAAKRAMRA